MDQILNITICQWNQWELNSDVSVWSHGHFLALFTASIGHPDLHATTAGLKPKNQLIKITFSRLPLFMCAPSPYTCVNTPVRGSYYQCLKLCMLGWTPDQCDPLQDKWLRNWCKFWKLNSLLTDGASVNDVLELSSRPHPSRPLWDHWSSKGSRPRRAWYEAGMHQCFFFFCSCRVCCSSLRFADRSSTSSKRPLCFASKM